MSGELRPRLPWRRVPGLSRAILGGAGRSFAEDCAAMIACLPRPPAAWGLEHVPAQGPLCLVANHYQRPGLWIGWAGALLADSVARRRVGDPPVHFLVIADLRVPFLGRARAMPGSHWVFERVASAWGMVPLPTNPKDVRGRMRALRELASLALGDRAVAIFPEGDAGTAGEPGAALPGTGRWLRWLAEQGVPIVPVAVAERQGTLTAAFGEPLGPARSADPIPAIRVLYRELMADPSPLGSQR